MEKWNFYDQAAALIPFNLRGYSGKVAVYYGVNNDPIRVGMDSVPGLSNVLEMTYGYPIIHARIQEYEGSGYRTFCGWLQIVRSNYFDIQNGKMSPVNAFVTIDLAPSLSEVDVPFLSLGFLPELFDAPCLNLGTHAELHWTADAFLASMPMKSREEGISWLSGFQWGYTENALPDQKPTPLPLKITDSQVWNDYLPYLHQQYPGWKFNSA